MSIKQTQEQTLGGKWLEMVRACQGGGKKF